MSVRETIPRPIFHGNVSLVSDGATRDPHDETRAREMALGVKAAKQRPRAQRIMHLPELLNKLEIKREISRAYNVPHRVLFRRIVLPETRAGQRKDQAVNP